MKKFFIFISASVWFTSCNPGIDISVENPSDFDRTEIVETPVEKLMSLPAGKAYVVMSQKGDVIPSQLTYDGKLIFFTDIKANESINYTIKTGESREYPAKTYGRFIAERKDDFAWENDRVAFRIYGHALIPIDGPSNGLDLWYKKTNDLVIDKWYKNDLAGIGSYHDDHGEGLDDYKVGRTLGGGMMAPFIDDSLILNENFVSHEVLENGPLRTTFKLIYKDITVDGKSFGERRTFSIDAGSQVTKVTQEYGTTDTLTVASGIIKRPENDEAIVAYTENGTAVVVYEEPESPKAGKVFVTALFPMGLEKVRSHSYTIIHPKTKNVETHSHVLGVTSYYSGQPITYYVGYGWDKFGFPTLEDFQNYVGHLAETIEKPLIVNFL
ncbi:MAG: DUF4861 domain-containing protein [Tannerella sp.]|jgi:hypothetical protein|nr:DUF4861 domain-containing protein [Tannerella sp.]